MSAALWIVAGVVCLDGLRAGLAAPSVPPRRRWWALGPVLAGSVVLVLIGPSVADALDVADATALLAGGIIIGLAGLGRVVIGPGLPWVPVRIETAWLVPLAFPVLLTPELVAVSLTGGIDDADAVLIGLVLGAGLAGALMLIEATGAMARVLGAVVRLQGAALVVVGVQLAIDGVRAV